MKPDPDRYLCAERVLELELREAWRGNAPRCRHAVCRRARRCAHAFPDCGAAPVWRITDHEDELLRRSEWRYRMRVEEEPRQGRRRQG